MKLREMTSTPKGTDNGANPEAVGQFRRLLLASIRIDPEYQRTHREHKTKKLVGGWDWLKYEPIRVNFRSGVPYCFAGQHRLEAMLQLGFTHAVCQTYTDLTKAQEAMLFASSNNDRSRNTAAENFTALLVGGDETALDIAQICREFGLIVDRSGGTDHLRAIDAVVRIYNDRTRGGPDGLRLTLGFALSTFQGDKEASYGAFLQGVHIFFRAHHDDVDQGELAKKLSVTSAARLLAVAKDFQKTWNGALSTNVARAIWREYNRGKRTHKLPSDKLFPHEGAPA